MSNTPILKQAQDKLRPFEHRLLDVFAKVFQRKRPPNSLRALQPLAMVFLLEALGLAFLLDRETVRLSVLAARGPGKGDDDDLLDDSDEMTAIRWASAQQDAVDRAYLAMAKERYKETPHRQTSVAAWIKAGYGPDRTQFEKQWGERNPIDPMTAPKCFDPSAQLSILDAVGHGDGYLGAFVSTHFLTSSAPKQISCMGQTLDLESCETLEMAAWRAVSKGWVAYLDHRGVVMGLRLIPRTDGIQTRLRAPLVNIVSMFQEDKRDEYIEQLRAQVEYLGTQLHGTAKTQDKPHDNLGAFVGRELAGGEHEVQSVDEVQGVGRMVWPDPDNAPNEIDCVEAISKHRRGEFVELAFPSTSLVFDNVRAWLMQYQMNTRAPEFDETGYSTCAVGTNGEIPQQWEKMKQSKRNSYPGFVLFAPDGSAKVTFVATSPLANKSSKKKAKSSNESS